MAVCNRKDSDPKKSHIKGMREFLLVRFEKRVLIRRYRGWMRW